MPEPPRCVVFRAVAGALTADRNQLRQNGKRNFLRLDRIDIESRRSLERFEPCLRQSALRQMCTHYSGLAAAGDEGDETGTAFERPGECFTITLALGSDNDKVARRQIQILELQPLMSRYIPGESGEVFLEDESDVKLI